MSRYGIWCNKKCGKTLMHKPGFTFMKNIKTRKIIKQRNVYYCDICKLFYESDNGGKKVSKSNRKFKQIKGVVLYEKRRD